MSDDSFSRANSEVNDDPDDISSLKDANGRKKFARTAQAAPQSKTDIAFWKRRVFKPVYRRSDGTRVQAANYAVEISFRARRIKWSLDTPNREAAAARAKEIFLFLQANGWEAAFARYRPKEAPKPKVSDITVGEFLREARATSRLSSRTFTDYAEALRRIAAEIVGVPSSNRKFDRFGGGHDQWIGAISAIKLSELTPEAIELWKREYLRMAHSDPISQRSARVSANSYLHRAKCLFSKQILKHLRVALPEALPFSSVEFERRPSLRYHSAFDVSALIAQARAELGADPARVELFKIFVLAAMCGLRRREIDLLPWSAFRFEAGILRIEATEVFHPKSEESIADIPLEPELVALFRGYHTRAKSQFVIESALEPKVGASYLHYRCGPLLEELCTWLRAHGVKTIRPLHTLRKEFGSLINRAHGIHAASRALRHSSIGITSEIYVDSRLRTTSGLGYLLSLDPRQATGNVLPITAAAAAGQ
jgi:integrase